MRAKVAEEQKNGGSGDMFGTWYLASHSDSKSVPHGVIPQDYLFRRLGLQNQSEIQQMVDDMCSKKGLSSRMGKDVNSLRVFRADKSETYGGAGFTWFAFGQKPPASAGSQVLDRRRPKRPSVLWK